MLTRHGAPSTPLPTGRPATPTQVALFRRPRAVPRASTVSFVSAAAVGCVGHRPWRRRQSSQRHAEGRCYQVVSTESQGLGVVATEPLLAGQLVTEEAPALRWSGAEDEVELKECFEELPVEQQQELWQLEDAFSVGAKTLSGIAFTNSFQAGEPLNPQDLDLDDERVLYLEISRFNHSCLPNCEVSWDDREGLLQIYAGRVARFPAGAHELRFTLEEDGATTECRLRTLLLDEAPVPIATFRAENERLSIFRAKQPEIWHAALSEFHELEAPDVVLKVTFRPATAPDAPIVTLRASTIGSDAEVELSQSSLEDVELAEHAAVAGQITHSYLLSSVLGGCLKAAKESRGLKVRFNQEGVMSNQFILKSRRRQLLCEALICPMAEAAGIKTSAMGGMGANMQSIPAEESIGF